MQVSSGTWDPCSTWAAIALLRRLADEFIEHAKDGGGVVEVVEDRSGEDLIDLTEPILERGHDPEVATATAEAPEEVIVLGFARGEEPPVRSHDVCGDQIVDRQPERAVRPIPPPSVSPVIPVVEMIPPVVARPKAWVA